MANIINKDKIQRQVVERHMRNSIEHSNPNLKDKTKFKFAPIDSDGRKIAENMYAAQDTINHMPDRQDIIIGSLKIDKDFKGIVTYRKKPFSWENEEIKIEFNSDIEFMDKFIRVEK